MKTFREFMFENVILQETGGVDEYSDADFERYMKGNSQYMTPEFEKKLRKKREEKIKARTQNVSGQDVRGSGSTQTPPRRPSGSTRSTQTQTPPRDTQKPSGAPSGTSQARPSNPYRYKGPDLSSTSRVQTSTPSGSGGGRPPSGSPNLATTPPKASSGPGFRSRLGRFVGPAVNVAGAAMDYKERRDAGQSKARATGGALSSLAGYAKGAEYGAKLGAKLPIPAPMWVKAGAGGLIGGALGQQGASAAYDFAADKTRPARQAVSRATGFDKFQQKQALIKPSGGLPGIARAQQTVDTRTARAASTSYGTKKGSGLSGIGGQTTVSKDKKGAAFISTGAGGQRKTVELAKTQLVRDPKTGKQVVGDLAFKGGKATYLARPSVSSRDTSLGARVGRALNIGRYSKAAETQAARQEYRTALKNTQTYQKKLGITPKSATAQKLPGRGVGPKIVGPKIVGPKIVGPAKVGTGVKSSPSSSVKPV